MGGDMAYYNLHPLERMKAMGIIQKQAMHSHPGKTEKHSVDMKHRGGTIAALGGMEGYRKLHPRGQAPAAPTGKKQTQAATTGTRSKKTDEEKRVDTGWRESKAEAKKLDLETQPIQRKIEKIQEKYAEPTSLLRSLKGNTPAQRKQMLNQLLPAGMKASDKVTERQAARARKEGNVVYNEALLKSNNIDKILKNSWLMKWETTFTNARGDTKQNPNTLYSEHHYAMRDKQKWQTMRSLARNLPNLMKFASGDMQRGNPLDPQAQNAAALMLLGNSGFRPGSIKYRDENQTFGITTLQRQHIKMLSKNRIHLSFTGKHQQEFDHTVTLDSKLHKYMKNLISYIDDPNADVFESVNEKTLNSYVKQFDKDISPKDLRTLNVNKEIFARLGQIKGLKEPWERDLAAKKSYCFCC